MSALAEQRATSANAFNVVRTVERTFAATIRIVCG